jgi:hypothetical protein
MPINLSTLLNASASIQLAKAWVNFDGTTATPSTIRSSYNVSSITKNGTGDYTVNFATALADANYTVTGSNSGNTTYGQITFSPFTNSSAAYTAPTTSSFRLITSVAAVGATNSPSVNIQVFGN